jgi:hypothetical protein
MLAYALNNTLENGVMFPVDGANIGKPLWVQKRMLSPVWTTRDVM